MVQVRWLRDAGASRRRPVDERSEQLFEKSCGGTELMVLHTFTDYRLEVFHALQALES